MVSVTSASRYITSASRYYPHYQSRSSMYIRGLIPRNFAELAEAVPFVHFILTAKCWFNQANLGLLALKMNIVYGFYPFMGVAVIVDILPKH